MKRDWDTVRDLLTRLEALPHTNDHLMLRDFECADMDAIFNTSYHMELLLEAGLVKGKMQRVLGRAHLDFIASRLTWEGHEFLDAIRSDTVWNKTKETFAAKGLEMTFDTIKSVAMGLMTATLG